jgi:hypothetical protein
MRKYLLIMAIFVLMVTLVLLSQPRARHIIFNGIIHFPEFAIMQSMKGGLVTRDFDRVMPWLDRQFSIVNWHGGSDNSMTPGLLENIKFAYKVAVLKHEREKFFEILEKTRILIPNNIDLEIMLASAYQFSDKDKALMHLENARRIIPSDQRIYHLANIILRNSNNLSEISSWCDMYKGEQLGDYENHKSTSLLGVGYRRIALEYMDGKERLILLNEGVQLNSKLSYEFILKRPAPLLLPSVRLATGGGIKVEFHKIKLFSGGELVKTYSQSQLKLYPETGYNFNHWIISTNSLGENIFIELPINAYDYIVDKMVIELTIEKLSLTSAIQCNS